MINRLSAVLCGLVIAGIMVLATAQSAKAAVPASLCMGNWVNAPCVVAEVKLAPAAPRLVPRVVAPRREVHRSKRVAQQKIAQQKVAQQKIAQQKPVRVAARTAKVCTGNWVNAACAAP
jgi:cell envelope opacity-associated protein A